MKYLLLSILSFFNLFLFQAAYANDVAPTQAEKYQGITITVNINSASMEELSKLLVGVGEAKAQRIVDYREKHGPFTSAEALMEVKGIGVSIIEKNRDRIQL